MESFILKNIYIYIDVKAQEKTTKCTLTVVVLIRCPQLDITTLHVQVREILPSTILSA